MPHAGHRNALTIEYLGLPQYPELLKTGEVVREQLKEIGIKMNIEPVDVSVWFDGFINGNYQITSAYQERTIDPDNFYSLVLRSGADQHDGLLEPQGRRADRPGRTETDMATRQALYAQLRRSCPRTCRSSSPTTRPSTT